MRFPGSRVAMCVGVSWALWSRSAGAQPAADLAIRRTLLDQAQQAAAAGDAARALELARRAGEIRWSPSLRAFAATQHLTLGQAVDALGMADECLREAERDPSTPNRQNVQRDCAAAAAQARARVGYVLVTTPDGAPPTLALSLNGRPLPRSMVSVTIPVDPGTVHIEATLGDGRQDARSAEVTRGQVAEVRIFPNGYPPAPVPAPSAAPRAESVPPPPPAPARAELRVTPSVPGADVVIDGAFAGTGSVSQRLPAGLHDVEVRAPGHVRWAERIRLEADTPRQLTVTLAPVPSPAPSRPRWVVPVAVTVSLLAAGALAGGVGGYYASQPATPEYALSGTGTWLGTRREAGQ